jgi:O-acetyl-ADP-ribose deacetylase (regulator of RNase III)
MKVIHSDKLKNVEFTFALGDLFDAEVDAIVSSEQTDFVLAGNPKSISGQIWHRYGYPIQQELDEATKGQVFRRGTVLDTTGGKDFTRIFHAGFHEPDDWPDSPGGSQNADYFEAIGSCIRQVLDAVMAKRLSSVAFPLIGGGVFGLDEKMLTLQFIDAVETLDHRLKMGETLNVWLVIKDRAQYDCAVGVFLDLLMRARREMIVIQIEQSGVQILDQFAARVAQRSNEDWAKWQLCRFTEVALEIMCYGLSRAVSPSPTPESLFEEGAAPTFGLLRELAVKFAAASLLNENVWGTKLFSSILQNEAATRAWRPLIHRGITWHMAVRVYPWQTLSTWCREVCN